jgi:hypothetical protein
MLADTVLADTQAIRALARADAAHSADLTAAAAALTALPIAEAAPSLGPVGARFLAALSDAATAEAVAATALADSLAAGSAAGRFSATAYAEAQIRATALLGG